MDAIHTHSSRTGLALAVILTLLAPTPARADGGGSAPSMPPPQPPPTAQRPMSPEEQAAIAKANAERAYADAYKEVEKGWKELDEAKALLAGTPDEKAKKKASEKESSAIKRFAKTAPKFEAVTVGDPKNANAWNMLGYTKRMTGDLDAAFNAYWKCLEIDPQHAGAHEYLGEAYLKAGKIKEAQGELAFLEKKGAPEAKKLKTSIDAWAAANPEAAQAAAAEMRTAPVAETK